MRGRRHSSTLDPCLKTDIKITSRWKKKLNIKKMKPQKYLKESRTSGFVLQSAYEPTCSIIPIFQSQCSMCRAPIHPVLNPLTCVYTLIRIHLCRRVTINITSLATKLLLILQNTAEMLPPPQNLFWLSNKTKFYLLPQHFT